jgi:hypothetical protein
MAKSKTATGTSTRTKTANSSPERQSQLSIQENDTDNNLGKKLLSKKPVDASSIATPDDERQPIKVLFAQKS